MLNSVEQSQLIKIFMASPSDVREERETLASLIREVNDVLAFLAPKRQLRLELMRYETHTYPDYGRAQDVINRQIPQDYDVFVGVMWKRCGTPTATSQSGTIEEFNRALTRREQTGRPTIMFYFCDEAFSPPRGEDLEQYSRVVRFREELESKGYTLTYPDRKSFRDYVRGGLLRAIADISKLNEVAGISVDSKQTKMEEPDEANEIFALASQYDEVRSSMPSGEERTKRMSEIKAAMRTTAAGGQRHYQRLKHSISAGQRLAAIIILEQFPDFGEIEWLADRLNPEVEAPFIGHASAVALAQTVRSLSLREDDGLLKAAKLKACLERSLVLAERNPHDPPRLRVLNTAIKEMEAKTSRIIR